MHVWSILQLYVGGNAALIGQKLATNPHLKVRFPKTWFPSFVVSRTKITCMLYNWKIPLRFHFLVEANTASKVAVNWCYTKETNSWLTRFSVSLKLCRSITAFSFVFLMNYCLPLICNFMLTLSLIDQICMIRQFWSFINFCYSFGKFSETQDFFVVQWVSTRLFETHSPMHLIIQFLVVSLGSYWYNSV